MKKLFLILIVLSFSAGFVLAQKPKPTPRKSSAAKPAPANEKEEFEKAVAQTDLEQRISALQKFAKDFPKSAERIRALELIVSARAQVADAKLRAGEKEASIALFKQAVSDAPAPMSDKLFSEVVLQFPTNLFFNGEQQAAIEVARTIEAKVGDSAKQILGLATFYIGIENGSEARRLANKALEKDSQMPAAYQTLGLANRLDFQLDESVAAYVKAAELDPNSVVSKRSLAEMKRAVGKPDEAIAIYRELLGKNADDLNAQTGLALALFDAEKQTEAETEMNGALEKNPNNLFLLVGAAYWYAAHNDAAKAIDFASRAAALEPRYTWAHIALARGFLLQNNYIAAEKELLLARQYGGFPTLTYELAVIRLAAGFYGEAAQELKKSFAAADDSIATKLGNRIPKNSKSFIELIAPERTASIFEPLAADSPEVSEKLKSLFILNQKISLAGTTDEEIGQAVNNFVKGDDPAKTHRQLYAANLLLQANKNLPRALKLTEEAVSGVDVALQTPNATSAIMADELFVSRTIAIARGEVIVIPSVPRQTLAAILRGRLEEIAGWTLYKQNKFPEAITRLKRSVSVLPANSAWWRSSMWRLGAAFDASDSPALALDYYVKSYLDSPPDQTKYAVIEKVYQKVNGSLEGLDKKIGVKPVDTTAAVAQTTTPEPSPIPTPTAEATPESTATPKAETKPEAALEALPTPTAEASPSPVTVAPTPDATPDASPISAPSPENSPMPKVETTPQTSPTPNSEPTPEVSPTPKAETALAQTAPSPESKQEGKSSAPAPKSSPSSTFEPVIIKVPPPAKTKSDSPNPEKSDEAATAKNDSGETRPRVIVSSNLECSLSLDQETISIIANGGNLGVTVRFQGEVDVSKINASSGSPQDISVALDPDISKSLNRGFFIVKSISTKTGIYTVTFDSPCGKKDLQVRVR